MLDTETLPTKNLTVSELVALLKRDIETRHARVQVVGEISSFKRWRSGHAYFDLKDRDALLPAVMFKPLLDRVPFTVTDGVEVLISGRVSVYAPSSRLQMVVERMEPLGQGARALAFEQLKIRLEREGLFDKHKKKTVAKHNPTIGIITSPQGAALRDMLQVISTRNPKANILFCGVQVQGQGAKEQIARALTLLDQSGLCDVIIVGRGGGSLEDLWAFNEEEVARAVFLAQTPIVSAVGHETDFTICDFVSDVRALTPTEAGYLTTIDLLETLHYFQDVSKRLTHMSKARLEGVRLRLEKNKSRLFEPRLRLMGPKTHLNTSMRRLATAFSGLLNARKKTLMGLKLLLVAESPRVQLKRKRERLMMADKSLAHVNPQARLHGERAKIAALKQACTQSIKVIMATKRQGFHGAVMRLDALSPLKVLGRGFSMVQDASGRVITTVDMIAVDDQVAVRLEHGTFTAIVINKDSL